MLNRPRSKAKPMKGLPFYSGIRMFNPTPIPPIIIVKIVRDKRKKNKNGSQFKILKLLLLHIFGAIVTPQI